MTHVTRVGRKLEGRGAGVWDVRAKELLLRRGRHHLRAIFVGTLYGQVVGPKESGDPDAVAPPERD